MVAIIKKVSTKLLVGKVEAPDDKKIVPLWDVIGVVNGLSKGSTEKGDWIALLGMFQANKYGEDVYIRASKCFLPDVAMNMILPQIDETDVTTNLSFGFRIGVLGDETSATGYVYICENILPVSETDPLDVLAKSVVKETKLLEGRGTPAAKEPNKKGK